MLTASCIWNSFRISGNRHLILTGTRGSGKTTLLKKLIPDPQSGLVTWAVPGNGVYLREIGTNETARIGVFDHTTEPGTNRMRPDFSGFQELAIPALQRCMESDIETVTIDEIGYLDTMCPEYCDVITALFARKRVIAVVRKQELPFLTSLLSREDAFVIDLDAPFGNAGCIIMASGMGVRFGGNKLMADFRGKPLIAGCLEATSHVPHRVVVTRNSEVAQYCRSLGIDVIFHAEPYRSDTVRLGLEALPETDCCIFCQGDQPLLRQETVDSMLLLGIQKNPSILRAASEASPGSPILFPKCYYEELKNLPQGKGGGFVAKKHPEQVLLVPVRDMKELLDVDTQEDLEALKKQ